MNTDKQNQVIAEELSKRTGQNLFFDGGSIQAVGQKSNGTVFNSYFDNAPTSDLNVCRLFEQTLSSLEWEHYSVYLANGYNALRGRISYQRYICELTPLQRCEAFLRTIGKWEGE